MKYLLDANVFIQADNAHYGFDLCPGFWDWLDQANTQGDVHSVEKVYDEITVATNPLSLWAQARRATHFFSPDQDAVNAMGGVAAWAQNHPNYTPAAVADFLSVADSYLVAYAQAHSVTVVTHERPAPQSTHRIKVPDACTAAGVSCLDPFEMLRTESVSFVLP